MNKTETDKMVLKLWRKFCKDNPADVGTPWPDKPSLMFECGATYGIAEGIRHATESMKQFIEKETGK